MLLALLAALGASPAADSVPLQTDLGTHTYAVATASPLAQRYFDQGLRLAYGFNFPEAARSFREAVRLDPSCAMCHWGVAFVLGPNVNMPMDPAGNAEARRSALEAARLAVRPNERAITAAMAVRYADAAPADRAPLDSAYMRRMRDAARRFPASAEIATLYAESLMLLSPWNYWTAEGRPRAGMEALAPTLERALARSPRHPGVCHYYIHAVEAVAPAKAVACAERLAALMPGAGHIVHMPGHIYIRVGRYDDAIAANVHATHTDETFVADRGTANAYAAIYYPHNYHFLAFAAALAGKGEMAIGASRDVVKRASLDVAKASFEAQGWFAYTHLTLSTFGRWDDILAEPMPPAELRGAMALSQYARGLALANRGRLPEARAALDSVRLVGASHTGEPGRTVLAIAALALEGEILARDGRIAEGIVLVERAAALEDALPYTEPPFWHHPIRHALGQLYLQARRPADAERVFRADLRRFPENGWSLTGLRRALVAQGRTAEATRVAARLERAWRDADVRLGDGREVTMRAAAPARAGGGGHRH